MNPFTRGTWYHENLLYRIRIAGVSYYAQRKTNPPICPNLCIIRFCNRSATIIGVVAVQRVHPKLIYMYIFIGIIRVETIRHNFHGRLINSSCARRVCGRIIAPLVYLHIIRAEDEISVTYTREHVTFNNNNDNAPVRVHGDMVTVYRWCGYI